MKVIQLVVLLLLQLSYGCGKGRNSSTEKENWPEQTRKTSDFKRDKKKPKCSEDKILTMTKTFSSSVHLALDCQKRTWREVKEVLYKDRLSKLIRKKDSSREKLRESLFAYDQIQNQKALDLLDRVEKEFLK